jgi:hypothetical protein
MQVCRIYEILRDLFGDHLFLFQCVHGHATPQRYCSVGIDFSDHAGAVVENA